MGSAIKHRVPAVICIQHSMAGQQFKF